MMERDAEGVARLLTGGQCNVNAYDADGRTALMNAAQDPHTDTRIVELLLEHGADLSLQTKGDYDSGGTAVSFALRGGDPRKVKVLVDAGAAIHFRDNHGHDALLNAVHHRDIAGDPRLLDLLRLLISYGVELNWTSSYNESGLRVLSRLGRFDAIRLLLDAGADIQQLRWTKLHRVVALGSVGDVQELLEQGLVSEDRDFWSRTPWLLSVQTGDTAKAQLLQDYGADDRARGRCGATPLSLAVLAHQPRMLRWLLDAGHEVDQTNDFGATALFEATESDDVECARILLRAGANLEHRSNIPETPLAGARSQAIVRLLLDAGADIRALSGEGRRALLGLVPDVDRAALSIVSSEQFTRGRNRRFGTRNPEAIDEPFWLAMIRSGAHGYTANVTFKGPSSHKAGPVWCANRFGQSLTRLPDGRIVQIAGEHEDHYDPDFCIYNDVFLHHPDGRIDIFAYPREVFPPTDFHTATLMQDGHIYVIGSAGYYGEREYGRTPVYRLDTKTFAIERIDCGGESPGWIYSHRASRVSDAKIEVTSGTLVTSDGDAESHTTNERAFVLDVKSRKWRVRA